MRAPRIASFVVAVLVPVAGAFATAGTPPALAGGAPAVAPAPERISVLQANVNGGQYDGRPRAIDDVVSAIDNRPDVATLQEVCQRQLDRLVSRYTAAQVRSHPHKTQDKCGRKAENQQQYYVLVSRWGFAGANTIIDVGGTSVATLCATVAKPVGAFVACSAKLDYGGGTAARVRQSKVLKRAASGTFAGTRLVMGGDFNAVPGSKELNRLYRLSRTGELDDPTGRRGLFWEGDETDRAHMSDKTGGVTCHKIRPNVRHCRTGQRTHNLAKGGRKIDYVFFKHDMFDGNSVALEVSPRQDPTRGKHAILLASALPNS